MPGSCLSAPTQAANAPAPVSRTASPPSRDPLLTNLGKEMVFDVSLAWEGLLSSGTHPHPPPPTGHASPEDPPGIPLLTLGGNLSSQSPSLHAPPDRGTLSAPLCSLLTASALAEVQGLTLTVCSSSLSWVQSLPHYQNISIFCLRHLDGPHSHRHSPGAVSQTCVVYSRHVRLKPMTQGEGAESAPERVGGGRPVG